VELAHSGCRWEWRNAPPPVCDRPRASFNAASSVDAFGLSILNALVMW